MLKSTPYLEGNLPTSWDYEVFLELNNVELNGPEFDAVRTWIQRMQRQPQRPLLGGGEIFCPIIFDIDDENRSFKNDKRQRERKLEREEEMLFNDDGLAQRLDKAKGIHSDKRMGGFDDDMDNPMMYMDDDEVRMQQEAMMQIQRQKNHRNAAPGGDAWMQNMKGMFNRK